MSWYPGNYSQPPQPFNRDVRWELSVGQREQAKKLMPQQLTVADKQTSLVSQCLLHREIQEKLKKKHNYVDNSPEGNKAFRYNCRVIHNPSLFLGMPARQGMDDITPLATMALMQGFVSLEAISSSQNTNTSFFIHDIWRPSIVFYYE